MSIKIFDQFPYTEKTLELIELIGEQVNELIICPMPLGEFMVRSGLGPPGGSGGLFALGETPTGKNATIIVVSLPDLHNNPSEVEAAFTHETGHYMHYMREGSEALHPKNAKTWDDVIRPEILAWDFTFAWAGKPSAAMLNQCGKALASYAMGNAHLISPTQAAKYINDYTNGICNDRPKDLRKLLW